MDKQVNNKKTTKDYDFKEYYRKNHSKMLQKHICQVCQGSYSYMNKSNHKKTQRHIRCLNALELQKELNELKELVRFNHININIASS